MYPNPKKPKFRCSAILKPFQYFYYVVLDLRTIQIAKERCSAKATYFERMMLNSDSLDRYICQDIISQKKKKSLKHTEAFS